MPSRFFKSSITFAINQSFFALLVIFDTFGIITIDPTWKKWIIFYIALNLLIVPLLRKQFLTPNIASPKCNFCDGIMHTSKLKCGKCGAESQEPKG